MLFLGFLAWFFGAYFMARLLATSTSLFSFERPVEYLIFAVLCIFWPTTAVLGGLILIIVEVFL